jgi:ribonuclease BN (tRNA processing enzyme)
MTLTVTALGVGDAFSALHYSSCLWVRHGDTVLLVDCPHPIRKILREAGLALGAPLDIDAVTAVVLTHLHADHASGLEGLGYFSYFLLRRQAHLLAHPDVVKRLWEGHLAAGMEQLLVKQDPPPWQVVHKGLADYFRHSPLVEEAPVTVGSITVECRKTIHHIPTTALKFRAGGRCLGYSADTAFDPTLIAWLSDADVIIHETNHGVHTPYADLAALPPDVRAKMRLIHYPDEFDVAGSVISPLRQGETVTV